MSQIKIRQVGGEVGGIKVNTASTVVEQLLRLSDSDAKNAFKAYKLRRKANKILKGDE